MFGFRNKAEAGSKTYDAGRKARAKADSQKAARGARSARSGNIVGATVAPRAGRVARGRVL